MANYPLILISELVTVEHGKYIVKVAIELQEKIITTAHAEGYTIEEAEDNARKRAIAFANEWVNLNNISTPIFEKTTAIPPQKSATSATVSSSKLNPLPSHQTKNKPLDITPPTPPQPENKPLDITPSTPPQPESKPLDITPPTPPQPESKPLDITPPTPPQPESKPLDITPPTPPQPENKPLDITPPTPPQPENKPLDITPPTPPQPENKPLDITPPTPPQPESKPLDITSPPVNENYDSFSPEIPPHQNGKEKTLPLEIPTMEENPTLPLSLEIDETMDFSQIIDQTTIEMKRLGWTQDQGKKYLLETYGKKSRHLLSDQELIEFLQYLQSQP